MLDHASDAFLAPLAGLRPRGARVYLGAIHNMQRFDARIEVAKKYLPDFGLGAFCGFGRMDPEQLARVLEEHLQAIEAD